MTIKGRVQYIMVACITNIDTDPGSKGNYLNITGNEFTFYNLLI